MAIRRVFIAWSHALFYGSVRLLLSHPDVDIVGASQVSETAWNTVRDLHPDAIILERQDQTDESSPIIEARQIWGNDTWHSRIILTGLHDNTVQVYSCDRHILEQAEDLLHLVLDE